MNKLKKIYKNIKKTKKAKKTYELLEQNNIKNDPIRNTPNQTKIRNPGIDLGRMIAMYAIFTNHILGYSGFKKKFDQYNILKVIYASLNWHNSGFVFISGYVGYKTTKYSNLIYICFWVFFYYMGINLFL